MVAAVAMAAIRTGLDSWVASDGAVDLTKLFKKAKLKKNAVVVVKVTAPGMIGKVVTYTVKPPKTPTPVTLCLSPGATAPAAC